MGTDDLKAKRQEAAKAASKTVTDRNINSVQWAIGQLKGKSKEVTAAAVAKLAGMTEATARGYLQQMKILAVRVKKTPAQKARIEKGYRLVEQLVMGVPIDQKLGFAISEKKDNGQFAWSMAGKSLEF